MLDRLVKIRAWQLLTAFCVVYIGGVIANASVLFSAVILLTVIVIGLFFAIKNG